MTEYYNNFTEALDKYIVRTDKIDQDYYDFLIRTYLCYDDIPEKPTETFHVAFRVPGATRGHIECDKDLMITDIVFYEDTCWGKVGIYNEDKKDEMISSIKQQFINTKLDIVNGIDSKSFIKEYEERKKRNAEISRFKENL